MSAVKPSAFHAQRPIINRKLKPIVRSGDTNDVVDINTFADAVVSNCQARAASLFNVGN